MCVKKEKLRARVTDLQLELRRLEARGRKPRKRIDSELDRMPRAKEGLKRSRRMRAQSVPNANIRHHMPITGGKARMKGEARSTLAAKIPLPDGENYRILLRKLGAQAS